MSLQTLANSRRSIRREDTIRKEYSLEEYKY